MKRILILGQTIGFLEKLCEEFAAEEEIDVCGATREREKAKNMILSCEPAVVVMSLDLASADGYSIVKEIGNKVDLIVIGDHSDDETVSHLFKLGVKYYFPMTISPKTVANRALALCGFIY